MTTKYIYNVRFKFTSFNNHFDQIIGISIQFRKLGFVRDMTYEQLGIFFFVAIYIDMLYKKFQFSSLLGLEEI